MEHIVLIAVLIAIFLKILDEMQDLIREFVWIEILNRPKWTLNTVEFIHDKTFVAEELSRYGVIVGTRLAEKKDSFAGRIAPLDDQQHDV